MKMPKSIKILLIIASGLVLAACATGQYSSYGLVTFKGPPIPFPSADYPIRSVQYYEEHYKVKLVGQQHDMAKEKESAIHAAAMMTKYLSKIRIGDKPIVVKPNIKYIERSKKNGDNDYILECTNISPIKKQEKGYLCWASCLQYVALKVFKLNVDQIAIAEYRKNQQGGKINEPNTIISMMEILGLSGLWLTNNGSRQLMTSLGYDQPVMVGKKAEHEGQSGHAIVIVGARYSYVNPLSPDLPPSNHVAYSELLINDPDDGSLKWTPANEVVDKIEFVLSFYVSA